MVGPDREEVLHCVVGRVLADPQKLDITSTSEYSASTQTAGLLENSQSTIPSTSVSVGADDGHDTLARG